MHYQEADKATVIITFSFYAPPTPSCHTSRYDFVPPVKYNYLDADEAEERFERRDKTLNYFSIMLSKRLKGQQEEGEGLGEEGAALDEGPGSKRSKKLRRKTREEEDGLVSDGIVTY